LDEVKRALGRAGIPFQLDAGLVRGLDYYTRTVYEIHHERLGAQSALGGGGRYDRLVEDLGGPPTAGVGFSAGMERIVTVAETLGLRWERAEGLKIYIAPLAREAEEMVYPLIMRLRRRWRAEGGPERRSLKNVLKHANRVGAGVLVLLGEEELAKKTVAVKRLDTGEQVDVPLDRLEDEIERLEASIGGAGDKIEE
jgi:histidyl-tRNA synthetase